METTSRHHILDLIELIANDIALASHYQELMNSYDGNDVVKYNELREQTLDVVNRRRKSMLLLAEHAINDNGKNYWCIVKHNIASWQYATECLYANPDNPVYIELQQKCYETMIQSISLFLGIDELVVCGRCLSDKLQKNGM